jgi:hypothetical protein
MKECAPLSRSSVPRIMPYDDDGIYSLAQCWPQRPAKVTKFDQEIKNRLGSPYRSGRSPHWVKVKNPKAPAVKREAEEDWGRC